MTATASDQALRRSHLDYAVPILRRLVAGHGPARIGRILDFGCGQGIMALGMALAFPKAEVVGVDIHRSFDMAEGFARRVLGQGLPANLSFRRIEPGQPLEMPEAFELIYSWSVMEHIRPALFPALLADLRRALRPGGAILTQVAPLYYSPYGSHLRDYCDEPWAHLLHPPEVFRDRLLGKAGPGCEPGGVRWMFRHYEELNRLTADGLAALFRAAGFAQSLDRRNNVTMEPPARLLDQMDRQVLVNHELYFVHHLPDHPPRRPPPALRAARSLQAALRLRVNRLRHRAGAGPGRTG